MDLPVHQERPVHKDRPVQPGAPGEPGSGPTGPNAGFYKTVGTVALPHAGFPPKPFLKVAELELRPGDYLAWAKLWVINQGSGTGLGYCFLLGGGEYDQALTTVQPTSGIAQGEAMSLSMASR